MNLKKGDYVRLDHHGRLEKCESTDFAYGTVTDVRETEVTIMRLGIDSRFGAFYVGLSTTFEPPPTKPDELDEWLEA